MASGSAHRHGFHVPPGDLWVFAYGSLMWNPEFPYVEWSPALLYGYHRALCVASSRWRGTPQRPGLVLGLDRGGACRGIAFRIPQADAAPALERLWRREMHRSVYVPRLLRVRLMNRETMALAFVADRRNAAYVGALSIEAIAERIAHCRGARGANLEYLARTLAHLAELGVSDHHLLRVFETACAFGAAPRAARRTGRKYSSRQGKTSVPSKPLCTASG